MKNFILNLKNLVARYSLPFGKGWGWATHSLPFGKGWGWAAIIMLAAAAGAQAQTINLPLTDGQVYSSDILGTSITINVASGTAYVSGNITGIQNPNSFFYKTGSGKLVVNGTISMLQYLYLNAGILQIGNGATSGGFVNYPPQVTTSAGTVLRFEPGKALYSYCQTQGAGSVEIKAINGTSLTITSAFVHTGGTTIEMGDVYIGNGTTSGAVAGNIVNNGSLYFNQPIDYTFAGVISGTGSVTKSDLHKLTLTGANTYTGPTTLNAGILQIGDGTSGSIAGTSVVSIPNGALLRFEPGADMVFDKVISGTGSVQFKGTTGGNLGKTLSLSANNTYTGNTTVEQGILCSV